ncbi:MAG TPA: LuxR C-terminal-related transcriptional regulator [Gaiellaceae bacterium]
MSATLPRSRKASRAPAHPQLAAASRRAARAWPRSGVAPRLTRRELEILRLASRGLSNRQIGELLWVTDETAKFHLHNVYRKLDVADRFEAAHWASEHGLLDGAER